MLLPAYGEKRDSYRVLDTCSGEAGRAFALRAATQIEPPGQREAGGVEAEIDRERELRPAGQRDRLAEAGRDQIAADGADRTDEANRSTALDARRLQGDRALRIALAAHPEQILLAEERGDHAVGRAVADARRHEQDQEHRQEADEILVPDEVEHADRGTRHHDEIPERDDRAADPVGKPAAE